MVRFQMFYFSLHVIVMCMRKSEANFPRVRFVSFLGGEGGGERGCGFFLPHILFLSPPPPSLGKFFSLARFSLLYGKTAAASGGERQGKKPSPLRKRLVPQAICHRKKIT